MTAYYNEHDKYAAQWLRNLISAGHIAPGDVDERSIEDVTADELGGYTQCHFFAGIGIWSHALRRSGWPDDRPVWTGSCPCQPFSAAGKGAGMVDERHLWPAWQHLIRQRRPPVVFGEQVASPDGLAWLDLVQTDMEGSGYALAANDLCAAGVTVGWEQSQAGEWLRRAIRNSGDSWAGRMLRDFAGFAGANLGEGGHHIRQRLYFVGALDDSEGARRGVFNPAHERAADAPLHALADAGEGAADGCGFDAGELADLQHDEQRAGRGAGREGSARDESGAEPGGCGASGRMDNSLGLGRREDTGRQDQHGHAGRDGAAGELELGGRQRRERGEEAAQGHQHDGPTPDRTEGEHGAGESGAHRISQHGPPAPHHLRHPADWLFCRDGRWRAVEPGTFPLAHAAPARVGRLRAYGNGLDGETAEAFVKSYMEIAA